MAPSLIAKLTDKQLIAEARVVAQGYCYSSPASSRMLKGQGMFSKTTCVTLEDGSERRKKISHAQLKEKFELLLTQSDTLKDLPLALCHIDLNILLDANHDIVGIVDWGQAALLPFGSNAWCIRYLSVDICAGQDTVTEKSIAMEETFWKSLVARLPKDILPHQRAIITAMQFVFTLFTFFDNGTPDQGKLPKNFDRIMWLEKTSVPLCTSV
ncbi:hypothetical protein ACEPAH_1009 [Sanghuangporus vaninii]